MSFPILTKERLNPTVSRIEIEAPRVAAKAQPGQFIILRPSADGERVPFTIADADPVRGSIVVIYQIVGGSTMELDALEAGDAIPDLVGPLGKASELGGIRKAAVVGGGVGCAIAYPVAKKLHELGCEVDSIIGFRTHDLCILENDFRAISDNLIVMTDDGSYGEHGRVTEPLERLLANGAQYDEIIAIGPLVMMKSVCEVTRKYGVKTTVSMNPIMIDGTGMCGGCRLTVGGQIKFACVDGPDFDGHLVDFDEAIRRSRMYRDFETERREEACHLMQKEAN